MEGKAVGWAKCSDELDLRRSTQFPPCVRSPPRTDTALQVSGARGALVMDDFRFRAFRFFPFVFLMLF